MSMPIQYAASHLRSHLRQSLLTMSCVGLVVGVFGYLLCISDGLRSALHLAADPSIVIVLAEPATAESNSAIPHDDAQKLATTPGIAHDSGGSPLLSCEYLVQANVRRTGESAKTKASAIIRGLDPAIALQVRPSTRLVAGRWFNPGSNELVVGETAARRFVEGHLGSELLCGDRIFTVVGVFSAGGGVHESEFWGYAPQVAQAYRRTMYSSASMRLESSDPASVNAACQRIASAAVALRGVHSPAYFASQGRGAGIIEHLAIGLVVLMGLGAVFAATNMMHATVSARTREIGVLRAIGFSPGRVVALLLIESLMLSIGGGLLGTMACGAALTLLQSSKDLIGSSTFSSVAFNVAYTARSAVWSLAIAALIGLAGGIWPARAAGRLSITTALRSA